MKFTVISTAVRENKGIAKVSGKPYHMHFQIVYAHLFDKAGVEEPFPSKVELTLELDEHSKMPKTYPAGEYDLHPSSFYMGQYGLELSPRLVPRKKL